MKSFSQLVYFLLFSVALTAQSSIERVEPPNWWVGMQSENLQLLVYGNDIGQLKPEIEYDGVKIDKIIKVENDNYLFIDLVIAKGTKAGNLTIQFKDKGEVILSHQYELKARDKAGEEFRGFDNSDVLYLITPDRFANSIQANDGIDGFKEAPNRSFKGGRHGGDIQGIIDHLDYIEGLGFTSIWLNPVLENDMEEYSYHGYSTTDFYRVDPRFGTNEDYKRLADVAREKGIKLIMDMIVNHCGSEHWWMKDLPMDDWINQWDNYTGTNHRKSLLQDPYASESDRKIFTDGWFVRTMPDLNQRNELMGTYLTQNGIWWIEFLGLAGIRMDTYPYPDMNYMTEWTRRVMEEYPNFNVVGEEWYGTPTIVAYWQEGKENPNGYTSSLRSLMDFPVQQAMSNALLAEESFGTGWIQLYEMLAQDFIYADPFELVVFPDNHDMSRIFSQVNEDYGLFQLALAFVLTTRGVPQLYYGTEILMKNRGTTDHGIIRSDFPGGWAGDEVNAFTNKGLTEQQRAAKQFVSKLLQWRKQADVIHYGRLTHFVPENGVYVYFRHVGDDKVMVALNKNEQPFDLDLKRFHEVLDGVSKGVNILNEETVEINESLTLPAKAPLILELSQ